MSYQSVEEIKTHLQGSGLKGEQFYNLNPEKRFEDLLERLEEFSRAEIDDFNGGESLMFEEDRVDTLSARDKGSLQLVFPVQEVKEVKVRRGNNWKELDKNRYYSSDFNIFLRDIKARSHHRRLYSGRNSLKRHSDNVTWTDIGSQIQVTYDRGYEDIPNKVKSIQLEIIERMLTHIRQNQNIGVLEPDDVGTVFNSRQVITEDIEKRIGKLTKPKNKYVAL